MATERIADMSIEDLRAFVGRMIDERLDRGAHMSYKIGRATPEVWQSIRDNVVEPAPGAPSPTHLLREERERWASDT